MKGQPHWASGGIFTVDATRLFTGSLYHLGWFYLAERVRDLRATQYTDLSIFYVRVTGLFLERLVAILVWHVYSIFPPTSQCCDVQCLTSTAFLHFKQVPTICYTLVLYKQLEVHMEAHREQADDELDAHGLTNAPPALTAGLKTLRIQMDKALASDYPLLGAGELFYFITSAFYLDLYKFYIQ